MKEKEFLKFVGKRINQLRIEKGLSFQELGLRSELEKSSLVKLCNHGSNITLSTLLKISKGLDVEIEEIFKGF